MLTIEEPGSNINSLLISVFAFGDSCDWAIWATTWCPSTPHANAAFKKSNWREIINIDLICKDIFYLNPTKAVAEAATSDSFLNRPAEGPKGVEFALA